MQVDVENHYSYSCSFICRRFIWLRFVHVACPLRDLGIYSPRRVPGVPTSVGYANCTSRNRAWHFQFGTDVNHCNSWVTKCSAICYLDRRDPRSYSLDSNTNDHDPDSARSRREWSDKWTHQTTSLERHFVSIVATRHSVDDSSWGRLKDVTAKLNTAQSNRHRDCGLVMSRARETLCHDSRPNTAASKNAVPKVSATTRRASV
jgi:hypothetical protein